jgi:histidine ammonia-lyase
VDPAGVARVARDRAPVVLAPEVARRVTAARAVVDAVPPDRAVYGVTRALGANKDLPLPAEAPGDYSRRVVMARAVAVGPALPVDVVRATIFARASAMATGSAGVSLPVLETLVAMLNAGVDPVVPRWGSIGAADLGLLATLALPLVGLGEAHFAGERLPGAEAMRRAGIAPVTLGAKDGLALVSANAASAGHGALVLHDARAALDALTIAASLSMEGLRANLSPLDPRAQAARPAPGQSEIAERLRTLLDGSALWHDDAPRSFQDPISFRCVSQVHGAALAALEYAERAVLVELNGAGDNPLVVTDPAAILHTGNFHVAALAQGFDLVAIALAHAASAAAERVIRLLTPAHSGLPANLTPHGPSRTGFATVQKTVTSLAAEMRHLAQPGSLDFTPVSAGIEDHASQAPFTVTKAGDAVERLRYAAAAELLVAAQAVDLRGALALGAGPRAALAAIRRVVPALDDDRPPGPDIERVHALLASGALRAVSGALRAVSGALHV